MYFNVNELSFQVTIMMNLATMKKNGMEKTEHSKEKERTEKCWRTQKISNRTVKSRIMSNIIIFFQVFQKIFFIQ